MEGPERERPVDRDPRLKSKINYERIFDPANSKKDTVDANGSIPLWLCEYLLSSPLFLHSCLLKWLTRFNIMSDALRINFLGTGTSTGLPLTPCLTLTQPYPDEFSNHLPLPSTSTSSSSSSSPSSSKRTPGSYDPNGEWPNNIPCACCRAAVSTEIPEGWKNKRGNTSLIVRKRKRGSVGKEAEEGEWRNVIVDVGKTFREQAMRFFTPWGIKRIDAVILTHAREWLRYFRSEGVGCLWGRSRQGVKVFLVVRTRIKSWGTAIHRGFQEGGSRKCSRRDENHRHRTSVKSRR